MLRKNFCNYCQVRCYRNEMLKNNIIFRVHILYSYELYKEQKINKITKCSLMSSLRRKYIKSVINYFLYLKISVLYDKLHFVKLIIITVFLLCTCTEHKCTCSALFSILVWTTMLEIFRRCKDSRHAYYRVYLKFHMCVHVYM